MCIRDRVTTVPPTGISPRPPLTVIVITSAPDIPRVMAMQDAPTLADAENLFLLRYHHNPPPDVYKRQGMLNT